MPILIRPSGAGGGIGRRARLRALWALWPVEVRVLFGAYDGHCLDKRTFLSRFRAYARPRLQPATARHPTLSSQQTASGRARTRPQAVPLRGLPNERHAVADARPADADVHPPRRQEHRIPFSAAPPACDCRHQRSRDDNRPGNTALWPSARAEIRQLQLQTDDRLFVLDLTAQLQTQHTAGL